MFQENYWRLTVAIDEVDHAESYYEMRLSLAGSIERVEQIATYHCFRFSDLTMTATEAADLINYTGRVGVRRFEARIEEVRR